MQLQTINTGFSTLNWHGNHLIDWVQAGNCYSLEGDNKQLAKYHFTYRFNRSIVSNCGQYVLLFERLATKALLLKNGEELREINRSYYCADAYEFPAAFIDFGGKTYLAHCPKSYCRIDFEDVETGELVTDIPGREAEDFFHSRFEVSPGGNYLISKGWVWHPLDESVVYDIAACFADPKLLDPWDIYVRGAGVEICTSSFIDEGRVLIGSSSEIIDGEKLDVLPSKSIGIWHHNSGTITDVITPDFEFGNLVSINDTFCWDTYQYPKIINIRTGQIVDHALEVNSGNQNSAVFYNCDTNPVLEFDPDRRKLAIQRSNTVDILIADI